MPTVGRNEPCPCGSGKKYKKCCMIKDTSVDLEAYRAGRAEESLRNEILKFATGARFKDEIVLAFSAFHSNSIDSKLLLKQDPLENIRFLDWFIHEYELPSEKKHVIELFGELKSKHLDEDQKKLLEEWKRSWLGAFEVTAAEQTSLTLADIFTGKQYQIEDESASEELKSGEVVVARMTSSWGKQKLGGAPIILAPESKEKLVEKINAGFAKYREEHPEADISEYLSKNSSVLSEAAADLVSSPA